MVRAQIKTQYRGWQNWINVENRGFSQPGQDISRWPRIAGLNQHLSTIWDTSLVGCLTLYLRAEYYI
jgi:hypothetical protein